MGKFKSLIALFFAAVMSTVVLHAAIPHLDPVAHEAFTGNEHFHFSIESHDHHQTDQEEGSNFDLIAFLLGIHTHSDYSHTEVDFVGQPQIQLESIGHELLPFIMCSSCFLFRVDEDVPNLNVFRSQNSYRSAHLFRHGLRAPPHSDYV